MSGRSVAAIAAAKVAEAKEILNEWQRSRTEKKGPKELFKRHRSTVDRPVIHGLRFKSDYHLSKTIKFNSVVVACIFMDVVLVGISLDAQTGEGTEDMAFFMVDVFLTVFFLSEMFCRTHYQGWDFFLDMWNVFDYSIVVLSSTVVVRPLLGGTYETSSLAGGLKGMRVFRLLRVVRFIKGIQFFQGLWMVIRGMLDSVRTIFWVFVLLFVIVYTGAVAIRTLVGFDDRLSEYWPNGQVYVGNVYRTMLSISQVVTLDHWISEIGRPLYQISPESFWVMLVVVVAGSFGALNVIVAVMIENMRRVMEIVESDTHEMLQASEVKMIESMAQDFQKCDMNDNGELELNEFVNLVYSNTFRYKLRLIGIQSAEAEQLFYIMDSDKNGSVSPEEFVVGLRKIRGEASGLDVTQIISFTQRQCLTAREYCRRVQTLNRRADALQEQLDLIGRQITEELKGRHEADYRYSDLLTHAVTREKTIRSVQKQTNVFPKTIGTTPVKKAKLIQ